MANVIIYYGNLLESSTVSVSNENTSFPKYRLYDRDIGKLFKGGTNPTNFIILIDQVTNMYGVSGLIIPAGHNLNSRVMRLQYSINPFPITTVTLGSGGSGYTLNDVLTIVQTGASGGTATVTGVAAGVITSISLTTGGTHYSIANGLSITGGTGTGATINVTAVDATNAVEWTQSGSGLINKNFAHAEKRYWRLIIDGTNTLPELAELFLYTYYYTFVQNVAYDLQEKKHRNISRRETGSGKLRVKKYGEARRYRNYKINFFLAAQKTALELWESQCEGFKSIYVSDHNGDLMFMEILNELTFIPVSDSLWSTELELMEVLA